MKQLKKMIFYVTEALSALSLFVMLVIVTYQVIARYLPMDMPSWTEELSRFLMIYIVVISSGLAIEKKAFVGMDSIYVSLSFKVQKVLDICFNILTGYLFYIILSHGFGMVESAKSQLSAAMRIPMNYIYISLPLLGFNVIFFTILDTISAIRSIIKNEDISISDPDEHLIYFASEEEKINEII